ncbi:hypothetical protein F5Y19DRAFT_480076 [Xylariaceae sp. FL1651]|nr:hypothetical protein F5Y19DRAFT_480076 [Xylariaceae sp. FL1651]
MEATPYPGLEVADTTKTLPQIQIRQGWTASSTPQSSTPQSSTPQSSTPQSSTPQSSTPQSSCEGKEVVSLATKLAWRWREWLLPAAIAAAATALIVGSTVGGALGAEVLQCRKDLSQQPLATTSTSPTSSAPSTPSNPSTTSVATFQTTMDGKLLNYTVDSASQISTLSANCDSLSQEAQKTIFNESFLVFCGNWIGEGGHKDYSGNEVILKDIAGIIAYSLQDCLEACSNYTSRARKYGIDNACGSVTFRTDLGSTINSQVWANCFLKNATARIPTGDKKNCNDCISATRTN